MNRFARFAITAICFTAICHQGSRADDFATDANIITALDISDSVTAEIMGLEIRGLAAAIRSPDVLRAVHNGHHGRIGFAVFAWHHDNFPELVGWTVISNEADANIVSHQIEMRLGVDVEVEVRKIKLNQFGYQSSYVGRLTDLSQAIDHASEMLAAAPFATGRSIINIIGEGKDNVGDDAPEARDRFISSGGTVNGLVLSNSIEVLNYYRTQVIGGPGAFAIRVNGLETIAEAMKRKFVNDLIIAASR